MRNRTVACASVVVAALLGTLTAGCYDTLSDPDFFPQEHPTTGTGGTTTTTTTVDPGCIPSSKDAAVDDTCGLFVSSSIGSDTNPGTKEAPLKSIAKALGSATGKPVYLCGESFDEPVEVKAGALVYGALDCAADWAYAKEKRTTLAPTADNVALRVTSKATLEMYDVDVTSPSATLPGGSSIGVFLESETDLKLTRSQVTAGAGAAGKDGEAYADAATAGSEGLAGKDACTDASVDGGLSVANTCGAEMSISGKGGSSDDLSGGDGSKGSPVSAANGGAGQVDAVNLCTAGTAGDPGTNGTYGAGASGVGTLTSSGYEGVPGLDGTPGKLGQGGGGGGGAKGGAGNGMSGQKKECGAVMNAPGNGGASGASGGAGGCGGAGGRGGGGGGASLGVVSLGATLLFESVTISSSNGGRGGNGGTGQTGGAGGKGASGGNVPAAATDLKPGCASGAGGKGGDGGLGGGGLGGPSVGLAYIGTAPSTTGASITIGNPGEGGSGDGDMGTGAKGVAAQTQAF